MGLGMATEHFLRFVSGDFDLKFCSKLRRRNILSKFYYFPVPRVGNLAKTLQTSKKKLIIIIIITCYTFARTHPPPLSIPSPSKHLYLHKERGG